MFPKSPCVQCVIVGVGRMSTEEGARGLWLLTTASLKVETGYSDTWDHWMDF